MSDIIDVVGIMERECVFLRERLASYRRRADKAAQRNGKRCAPADDLCERTEQRLADLHNAMLEAELWGQEIERLKTQVVLQMTWKTEAQGQRDELFDALSDVIDLLPKASCLMSAQIKAVEHARKLLQVAA
jgi:hypothetical protein